MKCSDLRGPTVHSLFCVRVFGSPTRHAIRGWQVFSFVFQYKSIEKLRSGTLKSFFLQESLVPTSLWLGKFKN